MDSEKRGIDLIAGANEALKLRKKNPSEERVMSHIMDFITDKKFKNSKMEVIIGAAHALKIAERHTRMSDKEILDQVMKDLPILLQED